MCPAAGMVAVVVAAILASWKRTIDIKCILCSVISVRTNIKGRGRVGRVGAGVETLGGIFR